MGQGDNRPIRVFLIAGQGILLWGLQQLVKNSAPALLLVGCASGCDEAFDMLERSAPDLVLLDLDLSGGNAAEAVVSLSARARVLALTRSDDQALHDRAVLNGARGILDRQAGADIFREAIFKVHEGQLWLDRAATGRIFVEFSRREAKPADPEQARLDSLTPRERKIVACLFEHSGASARDLAALLHISESTLRNHLTSIYGKLGIANRFELVSYALKKGRAPAFG